MGDSREDTDGVIGSLNDTLEALRSPRRALSMLRENLSPRKSRNSRSRWNAAKRQESHDEPETLICPICLEEPNPPVIGVGCGHAHCSECMLQLMKTTPNESECSLCRRPLLKQPPAAAATGLTGELGAPVTAADGAKFAIRCLMLGLIDSVPG